jgi:predicted DCC family thiol-disulfide oxidoreductase YuxK
MSGSWQIKVLYDGDCPLCSREVRFLEKCDRGRGRIWFENIADPRFDAADYGLEIEQLMARIHAVMPNGAVLEGVEVFRQAYAAVGLGWLMAPTRWPGLRRVADLAYRIFATNRLRWTGRESACETGSCHVGEPPPRAVDTLETAGPGPSR